MNNDIDIVWLETRLALFIQEFGDLKCAPYLKLAPQPGLYKKRQKPPRFLAFLEYTTEKPWETKESLIFIRAIDEFNKQYNCAIRSYHVTSGGYFLAPNLSLYTEYEQHRNVLLEARNIDIEYINHCSNPDNNIAEHETNIIFKVHHGTMPEDPDTLELHGWNGSFVTEILSLKPLGDKKYDATVYIRHVVQEKTED